MLDLAWVSPAKMLADSIAPPGSATPAARELALEIASAQAEVERIRQVRCEQIEWALTRWEWKPNPCVPQLRPKPHPLADLTGYAKVWRNSSFLHVLDRYERRALSRRKTAMRRLEELRRSGG